MAPEALGAQTAFTEKSDVWSFGVLLWELWALDQGMGISTDRPYDNIEKDEDVQKGLADGSVCLQVFDNCPAPATTIIKTCVEMDPAKRPNFKDLVHNILEAINQVQSVAVDSLQSIDQEESNCCICFENPRTILIQPCMHVCICSVCKSGLPNNQCPLCNTPITSLDDIFF